MYTQTRIDDNALNTINIQAQPDREQVERFVEKLKTVDHQSLADVFENLRNSWIPFLQKQIWLNKQYFAEIGGIRITLTLLRSVSIPDVVKIAALEALRNYAETGEFICILLKEGLVEALIPPLEQEGPLQWSSIGLLFALLEYDIKGVFASHNSQKITKLLLGHPKKITPFHSLDFHRVYFGCFYCLSCSDNLDLNSHLFNEGAADILLPDPTDTFSRYFTCLAIANLLLNGANRWPKKKKADALAKLSKFMKQFSPKEIREWESNLGMVWSYVYPFLRLTRSQEPIIVQFGVHCLTALSYLDYNRNLMLEENIVPQVLCLNWLALPENSAIKKNLTIFFDHFGPVSVPVPSLKDICRFSIRHKYFERGTAYKKAVKSWEDWPSCHTCNVD